MTGRDGSYQTLYACPDTIYSTLIKSRERILVIPLYLIPGANILEELVPSRSDLILQEKR
jgi:hypothetical protein